MTTMPPGSPTFGPAEQTYYEKGMESAQKYELWHTIIDIFGYYGGNMIFRKIFETPSPKLIDTAIFAISDVAVRQSAQTEFVSKTLSYMPFSPTTQKTELISLVSLAGNFVVDMVMGKTAEKAFVNNLIKNAISLGTNRAIDGVIPISYR